MRLDSRTAVLCAAAGAALSAPVMAQTADLSYKWREGVTLAYETVMDITQETASPFGNTSVEISTTSVQTYEVTAVRRGDGQIEVTNDSIKVEGDTGVGGRISYDSTNPRDRRRASDPTIAPFASMVGKSFVMVLNEAGEVQNLEGHEELAALSGATDAMFEAQLEQMWHVVPGEEVEVGETWSTRTTQTIPGVGEITVELEYTFTEMDSMEGLDVAVIEVTGSASMGRGARVQGMRVSITESLVEGVIHFAPDLGLVIESEQSQDLILEITGQGQSITQSLSSSLFMELSDVEGLDLDAPADPEAEPAEEPEEPAAAEPQPPAPEPAPPAPPATPPAGSGRSGGKP